MGLHICFELRLPHTTSDGEALRLLEQLRAYAGTLDLDHVSDMCRLHGHDLLAECEDDKFSVAWTIRVRARGTREERDGSTQTIEEPDRVAAAGFLVNPGRGCESAIFGLVRPFLTAPDARAERAEEASNWFWHSCCKTQYASAVSDEHLVRCHLAVVRILEEAARLGIGITVRDETGYWTTRSTDQLIAEVRNMNRIVARFAGAFHDKLSSSLSLQSPVFEHPDFERLESEPVERRSESES
jgi:hypothetical protein